MQLTLLSLNNQQIQTENLSSLSSLPHEIKQQQQLHNTKKKTPFPHITWNCLFLIQTNQDRDSLPSTPQRNWNLWFFTYSKSPKDHMKLNNNKTHITPFLTQWNHMQAVIWDKLHCPLPQNTLYKYHLLLAETVIKHNTNS
jgi:hypothetical protein